MLFLDDVHKFIKLHWKENLGHSGVIVTYWRHRFAINHYGVLSLEVICYAVYNDTHNEDGLVKYTEGACGFEALLKDIRTILLPISLNWNVVMIRLCNDYSVIAQRRKRDIIVFTKIF